MAAPELQSRHGNRTKHPLLGLLVSQALGAFNDNAWKQIVSLLVMTAVATAEASMQRAALAQIILLIPLILFNLPGGALADRLSKRTVILGMKGVELVLMLAGHRLPGAASGGGSAGDGDPGPARGAGRALQPVQVRNPPRDPAAREALLGQRPARDVVEPRHHRRDGGGGHDPWLHGRTALAWRPGPDRHRGGRAGRVIRRFPRCRRPGPKGNCSRRCVWAGRRSVPTGSSGWRSAARSSSGRSPA